MDECFVIALGKPREPVGVGNRGQHGTGWRTPVECVDLLVDALDHFKSDGDPMCGASVVSAMLASLGQVRIPRFPNYRQLVCQYSSCEGTSYLCPDCSDRLR